MVLNAHINTKIGIVKDIKFVCHPKQMGLTYPVSRLKVLTMHKIMNIISGNTIVLTLLEL